MKKHAAGETEEAQRDLARLALIRKERAEAAAKIDADKKGGRVSPVQFVMIFSAKEETDMKARLANPGAKKK